MDGHEAAMIQTLSLSLSLSRAAARLALVAAALAVGAAAAQKIDNVPPAVQNNVPPNFMFMIDNSGSMNAIVVAPPYDRTRTYLASCPNHRMFPPGATVRLNVSNGSPRIRYGNNEYPHYQADNRNGACFSNGSFYNANLQESNGNYGFYTGHYLNWYFGNYDPAGGWSNRKPGTESRMEVARRAAKAAIDSLPLPAGGGQSVVRVGLSTYRSLAEGHNGGKLLRGMADFDATSRDDIKASIDALTAVTWTPLASTLADIGRYMATGYTGNIRFQRPADASPQEVNIDDVFRLDGSDNPSARNACLLGAPSCSSTTSPRPIQYWCQRSSIFAVTDGRPTKDRAFNNNPWIRDFDSDCAGSLSSQCVNNGASGSWDRKTARTYDTDGSDYMDDVAKLLFDVDLRPDLAKPAPQAGKPAARNNIVTYMIGFADEAVQADQLLMNTARQGGGRFIAATDGAALEKAFAQVISDAITLDAAAAAVAVTNAQITAGTVGYASSYVSGSWYGDLEAYGLDLTTGLRSGERKWSARDQLHAQVAAGGHGARRIATWSGSAGIAFRPTIAGLDDGLVNYTRGDRSGEGSTYRARNYLLGDIINAEPVVVNYPAGAVVYQAANDGMLHAFDGRVGVLAGGQEQGGRELWAYVPRLVHGKLAGRASPSLFEHEYLVDATPVVAQVTGVGTVQRILVGGLGKGGAGYYALDISTGTAANEAAVAAKALWEFRPADMGYSFGTPLVVNTAAGWRVIVASGYRNDTAADGLGGDGRGRVWVLNPLDGQVEKTFVTPPGYGSSVDSVGLAHLTAAPSAGTVRHVYGGDLKGNLWRFDLQATGSTVTAVRVASVRDGNDVAQPISSAPVVTTVPASPTRYLIAFGTGQYFSIDDVPGTATPNAHASQRQTLYGIVDDTAAASPAPPDIRGTNGNTCPANGGNGDLVCQSSSVAGDTITISHNTVDLSSRRGYYLDIPIAGGRVNTAPALTGRGTLVVVVNVPTNAKCDPGGSSYLFQLSGVTGGAVVKTYGGSDYFPAVFTIGNALSSRPVLVTTGTGPRALLRLSDKDTESLPISETAGAAPPFRRIYMRPLN